MFVMSDRLYLFGGAGHRSNGEKRTTSMGNVDIWDQNNASWKSIGDLTIPRQHHALAYVGTQIFVLGGVTTIFMRCLSNVECYCTRRGFYLSKIIINSIYNFRSLGKRYCMFTNTLIRTRCSYFTPSNAPFKFIIFELAPFQDNCIIDFKLVTQTRVAARPIKVAFTP